MSLKDVIKGPLITEKTTQNTALGKYTFEVDKRATKKDVKRAVETYFKVKVLKVWTATFRKKRKKAIALLKEGDKIDIFESGE